MEMLVIFYFYLYSTIFKLILRHFVITTMNEINLYSTIFKLILTSCVVNILGSVFIFYYI